MTVWAVVHCWNESTVDSLWVDKRAAERYRRRVKGVLWRVKRMRAKGE